MSPPNYLRDFAVPSIFLAGMILPALSYGILCLVFSPETIPERPFAAITGAFCLVSIGYVLIKKLRDIILDAEKEKIDR